VRQDIYFQEQKIAHLQEMVLFFVLLKCTPLGFRVFFLRTKHDYFSSFFFCVLGQVVAVGKCPLRRRREEGIPKVKVLLSFALGSCLL
jgi:hypothetical protein